MHPVSRAHCRIPLPHHHTAQHTYADSCIFTVINRCWCAVPDCWHFSLQHPLGFGQGDHLVINHSKRPELTLRRSTRLLMHKSSFPALSLSMLCLGLPRQPLPHNITCTGQEAKAEGHQLGHKLERISREKSNFRSRLSCDLHGKWSRCTTMES